MSPSTSCHDPESLSASGRSAEKLSLPALQSKMKCDPESYDSELNLVYSQFNSYLNLFQQQAALSFSVVGGDPTIAKELGDRATFLAHVTPFYPTKLVEFPRQLAELLRTSARSLPSSLRCRVAQALILLTNRKVVGIGENLALFMELQTLGDRFLRKLAFSHIVHSIRRMNQKHKNEVENRALQNILFSMLQEEDEIKAKRSLTILCDLHRRKVWFDDRTANAICRACFHSSSKIMIAALSFLLDYEKIEEDDDSDSSSDEGDLSTQTPQLLLNKASVYKAHHKGTTASKKKKKAKLQRAIRSMKKQQRMSSENTNQDYYSPLNHLKDAQGFAENLFTRIQTSNERFEVKMMMLKVIARTIGLHRLILPKFYPFIQKYAQPHQRDVTSLLAAAVQACHDMVPPDVVESLFKQIVNQFVHDRSRTEAIAVGLNVVREICLRVPLLMTEDLLQDLVLYKKSHEKPVSTAARSLIVLFREVCPSMLVKKDRGRPTNPLARPKAFGEVNIVSDVPGLELLKYNDDDDGNDDNIFSTSNDDDYNDEENASVSESDCSQEEGDKVGESEDGSSDDENESDFSGKEEDDNLEDKKTNADDDGGDGDDDDDDDDGDDDDDDEFAKHKKSNDFWGTDENNDSDNGVQEKGTNSKKRKLSDLDGELNAANSSLRALRRLAVAKSKQASLESSDGILSNEDFQRIKELQAKKEARFALTQHGLIKKGSDAKLGTFKIPSSDQLSVKRVDPAKLEINIRKKLSKEERLALVRAGREDRGKYMARTAVKQKKTGGLSNRQKEHKKAMPLAAKRARITRSLQEKKRKQQRSGKQFRGRKAWK